MTIKSYSLTVPASPGAGTAVDVSDLAAAHRTFLYDSTNAIEVRVEVSPDNIVWTSPSHLRFTVDNTTVVLDLACRYVRAYRVGAAGGTQTLTLQGDQIPSEPSAVATAQIPADSAASTTTTATPFYRCHGARRVAGMWLVPKAAVTADSSNYATITVEARGANGTLLGTVAAFSTRTDSMVAYAGQAAMAGAIVDLSHGDTLTWKEEKAGTGVSLPITNVSVAFDG